MLYNLSIIDLIKLLDLSQYGLNFGGTNYQHLCQIK